MDGQVEMTEAQELQSLIEHEIPDARANLENSYANLERVAAYCEANYLQAQDKKAAFEETRRYTIQSLASVAYQINTLAFSLLQMIDMQHDKINDMVSQVNNIGQIVDIHKEKVARREIGQLTSAKLVPRQHKIIAPVQQEKPQRYARREIDYTILDEIGHGVKLTNQMMPLNYTAQQHNNMTLLRTSSTVSGGSSASSSQGVARPPQHVSGKSSLSKGSAQRVMSINAPMAPQEMHYGTINRQSQAQSHIYRIPQPPQQQQQPMVSSAGHYGVTGGHMQYQQPQQQQYHHMQQQQQQYGQSMPAPLPPPQLASVDDYRLDGADDSPPLPPPPMSDQVDGSVGYGTHHRHSRQPVPEWVPRNYIEKVIAVYDYQAEKADELSFAENAVIYVLRKNDDGWFEGISDGVTGLFPASVVSQFLNRVAASSGVQGD